MKPASILNDTLKDFNYYLRKLPKFLLQSKGFTSHFKIWYDILVGKKDDTNNTGVVGIADTMFQLLNIFNQTIDFDGNITNHYLDYLITLEDVFSNDTTEEYKLSHPYGNQSDILDKIGNLFGVKRSFNVEYNLPYEHIQTHLNLDNHDFLILIKAQIIKNYCNGTYEQIKQYYESIGLFAYITTATSGISNIYLATFSKSNKYSLSDDVKSMFLAGLLTIKSMGIVYNYIFINMDKLLIWNEAAIDENGWGEDVIIDGKLTTTGGQWLT